MYVNVAQGKFRSLGDTGLVDVRYIIEYFHILHDFSVFLLAELIGLRVEP